MLGWIEDGYTERLFIAAVDRLHPALRFAARRLQIEERNRWAAGVASLIGVERYRKAATILKDRISEWDLLDKKGEVLPISESIILKMRPALYDKLFAIVFGDAPPDLDPEASEEDKAQLAGDKF